MLPCDKSKCSSKQLQLETPTTESNNKLPDQGILYWLWLKFSWQLSGLEQTEEGPGESNEARPAGGKIRSEMNVASNSEQVIV